MAFDYDPNYISSEVFNKCTKTGNYGKTDLFKSNRPYEIPCDDFPEQYINVKISGDVESVVNVNGFDFEHYNYIGPTGGTLDLGERIKKVYVIDFEGNVIDIIWENSDGISIANPSPSDIIQEGRDHPIGSENITLDESVATGLTVPNEYVTYAIIQITAPETLIQGVIDGVTNAALYSTYLATYTLDGSTPSTSNGYKASHGTIIKLDSYTQADKLMVIANTDSAAYGSDIRPKMAVTYYIGTSRFGRI